MSDRLAGKVVVVAGGSSGIGRAVAERAAAEGVCVVVGARRETEGDAVVAGIREAGGVAAGGGSVVNNASLAGIGGIPELAPYTAAKHGVVGLTRAAALECAGTGVRVNALVTGNVDTPLYRRLLGAEEDGPLPGPAPNPTGRVAPASEIAAFVAFLLSDEAAFVTGAALAVDGGASA